MAAALALEVAVLQLVIGVDHYLEWAWTFALAGRGVTLDRIAPFAAPQFIWPAALILGLVLVSAWQAPRARGLLFGVAYGAVLIAGALAPTALVALPGLFPPILVASATLALVRAARDGPRCETLLPLVVFGTTLGALQSQGLGGSTFGIFPFLILGLASLVRELAHAVREPVRFAPLTGALVALALTVGGTLYTVDNARLSFIDVNAPGPVERSSFPSLAGLSARGPYLPELDEILASARDNIPADDAFVFLPGEDPAFFALGRRPCLPSVYFFDVATPYSPAEIARFAEQVGLRWVVVKDRLQLRGEPPLEQALVAFLTDRATLVARVGPYRVYRR